MNAGRCFSQTRKAEKWSQYLPNVSIIYVQSIMQLPSFCVLQYKHSAYFAGSSLPNVLCATMGCNSLQWFYILSSDTHAKQCNSSMFPILHFHFPSRQFSVTCGVHTYAVKFQMAVGMSDRAYQQDARADMKVCSVINSLLGSVSGSYVYSFVCACLYINIYIYICYRKREREGEFM